eukprot:TRINITY_DN121956_c0_g1_i1.p1 TRINITY_DN121956_c0_g1~~TRINITY_DN121956_c0_g1_i1.p1  ORF type:complete len:260 (+),score=42.77 TRINITY_DN121956_c0_g1_i1:103-882(+)
MQISIQSLGGDTITLDVEACDTVKLVKAYIQDKMGIPADRQMLTHGAECLEDGRKLSDYSIEQDASLHMVLAQKFSIYVTFVLTNDNQDSFAQRFDVTAADTIGTVKATACSVYEGDWESRTGLYLHGNRLDDSRTLADYNIQADFALTLFTEDTSNDVFQVMYFIRCHDHIPCDDGGDHQVYQAWLDDWDDDYWDDLRPNSLIFYMKSKLERFFGCPRQRQRLFLDGKPLEDDCKLRDYGISSKSVILVDTQSAEKEM